MVHITFLTQKQQNMLDIMWRCDTVLDVLQWQSTLNESDYKLSISLQELLIVECFDEIIAESDLAEAKEVIERLFIL